jgi:hypothetical protein
MILLMRDRLAIVKVPIFHLRILLVFHLCSIRGRLSPDCGPTRKAKKSGAKNEMEIQGCHLFAPDFFALPSVIST